MVVSDFFHQQKSLAVLLLSIWPASKAIARTAIDAYIYIYSRRLLLLSGWSILGKLSVPLLWEMQNPSIGFETMNFTATSPALSKSLWGKHLLSFHEIGMFRCSTLSPHTQTPTTLLIVYPTVRKPSEIRPFNCNYCLMKLVPYRYIMQMLQLYAIL